MAGARYWIAGIALGLAMMCLPAQGLYCYDCFGTIDKAKDAPTSSSCTRETDCVACKKVKTKIDLSFLGSYSEYQLTCTTTDVECTASDLGLVTTTCCTTDDCNAQGAASTMYLSFGAVLLSLVALLTR